MIITVYQTVYQSIQSPPLAFGQGHRGYRGILGNTEHKVRI